jgi:hypothetical protein
MTKGIQPTTPDPTDCNELSVAGASITYGVDEAITALLAYEPEIETIETYDRGAYTERKFRLAESPCPTSVVPSRCVLISMDRKSLLCLPVTPPGKPSRRTTVSPRQ